VKIAFTAKISSSSGDEEKEFIIYRRNKKLYSGQRSNKDSVVENERGFLTNTSTATTPLSQFVPFALLSQAQIAPIATRPVLRVK
jgi:hypothetical protein